MHGGGRHRGRSTGVGFAGRGRMSRPLLDSQGVCRGAWGEEKPLTDQGLAMSGGEGGIRTHDTHPAPRPPPPPPTNPTPPPRGFFPPPPKYTIYPASPLSPLGFSFFPRRKKIFGHARIAARFCSAPMPDFAPAGFVRIAAILPPPPSPAPWNCSPFADRAVLCVPLAQRLGLGAIPGYLLAGGVIGPSGWGWSPTCRTSCASRNGARADDAVRDRPGAGARDCGRCAAKCLAPAPADGRLRRAAARCSAPLRHLAGMGWQVAILCGLSLTPALDEAAHENVHLLR